MAEPVRLQPRTMALVEVCAMLWQERRQIQDMANDPAVSDAALRSFCRTVAVPATQEDVAWAIDALSNRPASEEG